MVDSPAAIDYVIASYAVHSIYIVSADVTEHPVRTAPALQEVSFGTAAEYVCSGVAVEIFAPQRTICEIISRVPNDLTAGSLRGEDLYGDSAADTLRGGPHADFVQGGRGPDRMFGYVEKDYIDGVDGIAGNDELDGGWGIDHCVGDEGDTFVNCDGNVVEVPVPPGTSGLETAGH